MKKITLAPIIFAFLNIGAPRYMWPDERDGLTLALTFRTDTPTGVEIESDSIGLVCIADVLYVLAELAEDDEANLEPYGVTIQDLRTASQAIFDSI